MGNGLRKKYIILLMALVTVFLASLVIIFINIGKSFMVSDKIKLSEVKVTSENIEDYNIDKDLDSEEFRDNLYCFFDGELYGFKNSYGEVVIKPKYVIADNFSEGLAWVYIDGKYGYIDSNENIVIECKYDLVVSFKNGLAIVNIEDNKQGVIDKDGNELFITEEYRLFDIVGDYIIATAKNSKDYDIGYLNKKGERVGELKYSTIDEFKYGYAKVEVDGKYGFINEKGEEVVPLIYESIDGFSEGYAVLNDYNGSKLIDTNLKEVKVDNIDFSNTYWSFNNGVIIGQDSNSLELVLLNKEYKEISRISYDYYFSGSGKSGILAFYNFNDRLTFTDLYGNVKFEIDNAKIAYNNKEVKEDYFLIEKLGLRNGYGAIDSEGNEIIPFEYSDINVKDEFFICTKEGLFGNKVDIYYRNNKIMKSIKTDLIISEGEGMISIIDGNDDYYINKYGQKFLKYLE